jgi:Protein of unknown function DUF58
MKAKYLAWTLIALAALLAGLGAGINSWFYALGGTAITLYVAWRYFTFTSVRSGLQIAVTRAADKEVVSLGSVVTFDVTVSSNLTVKGVYTELLPEYVALIEGHNSKAVSLAPGVNETLRYTVQLTSRSDFVMERVQFTLDDDLFAETIDFAASPVALRQPSGALTIEKGTEAGTVGAGVESTSVADLYRGREIGSGMDVAYEREYVRGDPAKRINWKTSARKAELIVKEMMPEFERSVLGEGAPISLIVDQTHSMVRGVPGQTNLSIAVDFAGRFIKLGVRHGSPLSLVTYDEDNVSDLELGDSPLHVTNIVDTLNRGEFEGQRRDRGDVEAPSHWKPGMTSVDLQRLKGLKGLKGFFPRAEEDAEDEDARRFLEIVSYLYAHEEGYVHDLERSPAFRAICTSLTRGTGQSMLVVLSDLENDLDPLIEGIRLATKLGNEVYVVALFPTTFETSEERLVHIEALHTSYEKHRLRVNKIREIKGVTTYDVTVGDGLEARLIEKSLLAAR